MPDSDRSTAITSLEQFEQQCTDADRAGDLARTADLAARASEAARANGDHRLLARAQSWLAHVHLYRGAIREGLSLASQAEPLARRVGDELTTVRLYSVIGSCEFQMTQHAAAKDTLQAGIALADACGLAVPAAAMRGTLGSVLGALGRFDEGEAAFTTALEGLAAAGDERRRLRVQGNLAGLLRRRAERAQQEGDEAGATAAFARGLAIALEVYESACAANDTGQIPYSLGMLGSLSRGAGDLGAAERYLRESLALGEHLGNQRIVAMGAIGLARVLRDQSRFDEALDTLSVARAAGEAGHLTAQLAESWFEEAAVHEARGDLRAALDAHRRFHALDVERLAADRVRDEQSRTAMEEVRRLRRETDAAERKAAAAERLARLDPLTGLLNRAGFDTEAMRLVEVSHRDAQPLTMAWVDVDLFKQVNDRFGHSVGDTVLAAVGRLCRDCLREGDVAARLGGDEFAVLIPGADREAALGSIERLHRAAGSYPWEAIAPGLAVTLSVGVAHLKQEESLAALARRADTAMYVAKRNGRNRVSEE